MPHDRDDTLLAVLSTLLDAQGAADRLLLRLRTRGAEPPVKSSGVFRVADLGHRIARNGRP